MLRPSGARGARLAPHNNMFLCGRGPRPGLLLEGHKAEAARPVGPPLHYHDLRGDGPSRHCQRTRLLLPGVGLAQAAGSRDAGGNSGRWQRRRCGAPGCAHRLLHLSILTKVLEEDLLCRGPRQAPQEQATAAALAAWRRSAGRETITAFASREALAWCGSIPAYLSALSSPGASCAASGGSSIRSRRSTLSCKCAVPTECEAQATLARFHRCETCTCACWRADRRPLGSSQRGSCSAEPVAQPQARGTPNACALP